MVVLSSPSLILSSLSLSLSPCPRINHRHPPFTKHEDPVVKLDDRPGLRVPPPLPLTEPDSIAVLSSGLCRASVGSSRVSGPSCLLAMTLTGTSFSVEVGLSGHRQSADLSSPTAERGPRSGSALSPPARPAGSACLARRHPCQLTNPDRASESGFSLLHSPAFLCTGPPIAPSLSLWPGDQPSSLPRSIKGQPSCSSRPSHPPLASLPPPRHVDQPTRQGALAPADADSARARTQ